MSLFNPLPVEPTFTNWRGHRIAHYEAGEGQSILLVHSINAAASAFEMRAPFSGLQDSFRVHAIDLLGFGRSDRPARRYTAGDYVDLIGHTLQQLGSSSVIIASTLSAAYAAAVAARWPELVHALVLICPTGISQLASPPGPLQFSAFAILRGPIGAAIYRALTIRPSVRYFLERQTYGDPARVTSEVLEGFYQPTKQAGARYAPLCFVSGLLNCDISSIFANIARPILLVWGHKAQLTKFQQSYEFLVRNPRARLVAYDDCGMIAQDERPDLFNADVKEFLQNNG